MTTVMKLKAEIVTAYEMFLEVEGDEEEVKETLGRLTDKLSLDDVRLYADELSTVGPKNVRISAVSDEDGETILNGEGPPLFYVGASGAL